MPTSTSVGLRLQNLSQKKQVVVLARLASSRSEDGSFSPAELVVSFDAAALPRPARVSNVLAALAKDALVTRRSQAGRWWLTPKGRDESLGLMSEIDLQIVTMEAATSSGAALGHLTHPVLPPTWAPTEIVRSLGEFLEVYPFDTNVFAMTRFPPRTTDGKPSSDPLSVALMRAREACSSHGLTLHLASDRLIVDDLWGNVLAHMWACRYGIALFEDGADRGINYNLTIEVGGMLLAGRRTALLKDKSVPAMPTDLVGKIYKSVDLGRPATIAAAIHDWIRDDLRLGGCAGCAKP